MAPSRNLSAGRNTKIVPATERQVKSHTSPVQIPAAQTLPSKVPYSEARGPKISPPGRPYTAVLQSRTWSSADNASETLIFRDRHGYFRQGTEYAGRISSMPDPPSDGPIRPIFNTINRTYNHQVGLGTAYADDFSRPYTGVGEQIGGWTIIYGGQPKFYRNGPGGAPSTADDSGPGKVYAGPPHGYHTFYPPDGQQTIRRAKSTPQMVATRADRISNSRSSGQNYSQRTTHQGG